MDRFMNDSVIDPLFWEHLQLPKGLLKEQKFAATISIQQENCPEKSFKILESLHKVTMALASTVRIILTLQYILSNLSFILFFLFLLDSTVYQI